MSVDHLVWAVPELATAADELEAALGVRPSEGGRHEGRGTHNALLALGDRAYLEVLAPDPSQKSVAGPVPFDADTRSAPRLVAWATRADDIDARVSAARAAGYDPGDVIAMSRIRPDGVVMRWRLTTAFAGPVPFLIDWGDSPHPSETAAHGAALVRFHLESPEPDELRAHLRALRARAGVADAARPGLVAIIEGPRGSVMLS